MSQPLPPPPPPSAPPSPGLAGSGCYRHPNREAGRRCTRCGRPACTECLVQADIGSQCVDCAKAARPDTATRVRYWNARQPSLIMYSLVAINLAVFALMGLADPDNFTGRGRLTQQQIDLGLLKSGAVQTVTGVEMIGTAEGEWYRVITSAFLHFGFLHIAFNMLLLFQLGNLLEPAIGRVRFGLLYFAALLGGAAGVLIVTPYGLTGGASGAVFGLLGAAAVALHRRGVNPFSTGIGSLIVLNLLITFTMSDVSIGGHIGGLIAGAVAGWFAAPPGRRGYNQAITYAGPAAIALVCVVVCFVVGSA